MTGSFESQLCVSTLYIVLTYCVMCIHKRSCTLSLYTGILIHKCDIIYTHACSNVDFVCNVCIVTEHVMHIHTCMTCIIILDSGILTQWLGASDTVDKSV